VRLSISKCASGSGANKNITNAAITRNLVLPFFAVKSSEKVRIIYASTNNGVKTLCIKLTAKT